jgi:hypothetical protein
LTSLLTSLLFVEMRSTSSGGMTASAPASFALSAASPPAITATLGARENP